MPKKKSPFKFKRLKKRMAPRAKARSERFISGKKHGGKMLRTHHCNELTTENVGNKVRRSGWAETIRDHGGVIFIDLRDHYGVTQVVLNDEKLMNGVNRETVISIVGDVRLRDSETVNAKLSTGLIEVYAESLEILGTCKNMLICTVKFAFLGNNSYMI